MKKKTTITLLSTGVFIGFIAGLIKFVIIDAGGHITANRYIFYKAGGLVARALGDSFLKWLILTAAAAFIFWSLVWLLKILLSKIYPKYKTIVNIFLVLVLAGIVFVSLGWGINHYLIPYGKFHPLSLLADAGILVFSIFVAKFLWKILSKIQWKKSFNRLCQQKYPRTTALVLVALLLLLNIGAFIYTGMQGTTGPNFVFIVIDALRQDHLGCYGYHRNTSPCLNELAEAGVIFNHAYTSSPWTKPAVASLFTSLHPNHHGTLSHYNTLPERAFTLAEVLKNQGYSTYFLTGGNNNIDKKFNFHQGFDYFFNERISADHLTDNFLSLLPELRSRKFFAYIHYMDTHLPYNKNQYNDRFMSDKTASPPFEPGNIRHNTVKELEASTRLSPADKEYLESLYDGQIRFVDENIKRIISLFKSNNMLENTLVVITSDHGEEFWDHQNFEHGHTMYNELLRVPLIITGNQLQHLTVNRVVRLIDLLPTVVQVLDLESSNYHLKGAGILNLLKGKKAGPGRPVFAMGTLYGDEKYCLIKDNKKIIINTKNKKEKGELIGPRNNSKLELYDMIKDPQEKENLTSNEPRTAARLKKLLEQFITGPPGFKSKKTTLDKKTEEQLKTLGYL